MRSPLQHDPPWATPLGVGILVVLVAARMFRHEYPLTALTIGLIGLFGLAIVAVLLLFILKR